MTNLTSTFFLNFEKILFLQEVMDEVVFSSLIAFNDNSLQSVNTSLLYYMLSLVRHAISSQPDHATIFVLLLPYLSGKSESDQAALLYQRVR